jgi:hypothetical protein
VRTRSPPSRFLQAAAEFLRQFHRLHDLIDRRARRRGGRSSFRLPLVQRQDHLLHSFGIRISLLQFRQLALRLVEPLPDDQIFRLAQSLLQALLPLTRLAILLQLGEQVGRLGVGRVELQRPLVLAFRPLRISLAHGMLTGADRLPDLAQAVTFLDRPHFQVAHPLRRWGPTPALP